MNEYIKHTYSSNSYYYDNCSENISMLIFFLIQAAFVEPHIATELNDEEG